MTPHDDEVAYSAIGATKEELGRLSRVISSGKVTWTCPRCGHEQVDEVRTEVPFVTDADFEVAGRVAMETGFPRPRFKRGFINLICKCDSSHGRDESFGCGFSAKQLVAVSR